MDHHQLQITIEYWKAILKEMKGKHNREMCERLITSWEKLNEHQLSISNLS